MSAIDSLIDFLMSLMRDEKTRLDFERDPESELADRGLENVTGQDVRDARLMMADDGMARPRTGATRPDRGDDDVVREIRTTTNNFEVNNTVVAVDDRDTNVIVDSFNSDTDVLAVQDNDVIDNSVDNSTDVDVLSIEDNDTTVAEPPEPPEEDALEPAPEPEQEFEPEVTVDPVLAGPADEPFDPAFDQEPVPLDPVVG
jgi:hypothetical protein